MKNREQGQAAGAFYSHRLAEPAVDAGVSESLAGRGGVLQNLVGRFLVAILASGEGWTQVVEGFLYRRVSP